MIKQLCNQQNVVGPVASGYDIISPIKRGR